MPFEHTLRVRFQEADPAGIAFFGQVFFWCHEAYEELLRARGFALAGVVERRDFGLPIAHAEADYERPIRAGQLLRIEVAVERLGGRSYTLQYAVRGEDGALHARAKTVHVAFDPRTGASIPLPEALRSALEAVQAAGARR